MTEKGKESAGLQPVALVTGAGRGLGLQVARQLGEHGYHVLVGAGDPAAAAAAVAGLARVAVLQAPLDVADARSVGQAVAAVHFSAGPARGVGEQRRCVRRLG